MNIPDKGSTCTDVTVKVDFPKNGGLLMSVIESSEFIFYDNLLIMSGSH